MGNSSVPDQGFLVNNRGDWELVPGPLWPGTPSLQEDIQAGDTWERKQIPWQTRFGAHCPVLLWGLFRGLIGRRRELSTLAAVVRFATRCGLRVLEDLTVTKDLENLWRQIFPNANELALLAFLKGDYRFNHLGVTKTYLRGSLYLWVEARLQNLRGILGLDLSTLALIAAIFGLCQDDDGWIPPSYRNGLEEEVKEFYRWLKERRDKLSAFIDSLRL
ncbi:MAG: hypothetical protein HPY90_10065 [Syntrophothermus sp.]|uniref:hypothetical protein n=1 Tax=Syntrophothermus sp. TaxID=2736299 RepID=UPI002579C79E|nr:hypothetical protein [Syntrophothermus sp.]NSW83596.1 hypothetical protein [Syntrophothermus sp.]